jgi:hypothetical protein
LGSCNGVSAKAGKLVFTLPICLRNPKDPGYPPSDKEVYSYFKDPELSRYHGLSFTVHIGVACFIAAAHKVMHDWLKREQHKIADGRTLLETWHEVMEPTEDRSGRDKFFETVIKEAYSVSGNLMFYRYAHSFFIAEIEGEFQYRNQSYQV